MCILRLPTLWPRYVGGGSINLAFAKELGLNPASNDYKQMHKAWSFYLFDILHKATMEIHVLLLTLLTYWTQALLEAAAATPGSLVRGVDVPAAVTS